jgi:polyisoprenoid-binding protein YceI
MEITMKLFRQLALAAVLVVAVASSRTALADDGATADSIVVLAKHSPAKPTDPVQVRFEKFQVTKAAFDPKKIEGGKATIEIDVTSLNTGDGKRNAHLSTPDYLDIAKFPKIAIDIDKVKKKADKTFTAEATVKFRDVAKKYPVTFDVIETKADSIRIKSEVAFSRLDFKVGKEPKDDNGGGIDTSLTIQLQLTLKRTSSTS